MQRPWIVVGTLIPVRDRTVGTSSRDYPAPLGPTAAGSLHKRLAHPTTLYTILGRLSADATTRSCQLCDKPLNPSVRWGSGFSWVDVPCRRNHDHLPRLSFQARALDCMVTRKDRPLQEH